MDESPLPAARTTASLNQMVITLVPSLSKSLAERFNVFRVMHHGTHEKQISNVFAWLLRSDGTHDLGDTFQRILVDQVNQGLPDDECLPTSGYRVQQEVDTSPQDELGQDIADIVLSRADASIVVENFESSDGHGHEYNRYLAYGAAGGRKSAVVLLCARHEPHRQRDGWEQAIVMTYADLLGPLKEHVVGDSGWRREHNEQHFFIEHLLEHFMEGSASISQTEQIEFIKAMCETGESARYGYRPHDSAALEFAELLAQHAKKQFEDGRKTLGQIKRTLKQFAEHTLVGQLNSALSTDEFTAVATPFVGQWEWSVAISRANGKPSIFLEFGPTAVVENTRAPKPLDTPDYSRVFVTRHTSDGEGIDQILQTDVELEDVLSGLAADDTRLRDAVLAVMRAE